jgi:hypothetical protein
MSKQGKHSNTDKEVKDKLEAQLRILRALNFASNVTGEKYPETLEELKALSSSPEFEGFTERVMKALDKEHFFYRLKFLHILTPDRLLDSLSATTLGAYFNMNDKIEYISKALNIPALDVELEEVDSLIKELDLFNIARELGIPVKRLEDLTEEVKARIDEKIKEEIPPLDKPEEVKRLANDFFRSDEYIEYKLWEVYGLRWRGGEEIKKIRDNITTEFMKIGAVEDLIAFIEKEYKHLPTRFKNRLRREAKEIIRNCVVIKVNEPPPGNDITWEKIGKGDFNILSVDIDNQKLTEEIRSWCRDNLPGFNEDLIEVSAPQGVTVEITKEEASKLHRQPRNSLKSFAKLVGKTTDSPTLFSLTTEKRALNENPAKDIISKNTAILGQYLIQLWQRNKNEKGELVLEGLADIARVMKNSNYEIKLYLLYLGGYTYPFIDMEKDSLTISLEQLFHISFVYGKEVRDKFQEDKVERISTGGNKPLFFIKNETFKQIIIKPNERISKALKGEGLSNVLVTDDFIQLALNVTDIAYKIFTYSASNKPSQKIAEDNLVKHLGLEKQIKTQGRPRVRATILKGLQELQDQGHIKKYSYDEEDKMYSFTYSEQYVKHKDHKGVKK